MYHVFERILRQYVLHNCNLNKKTYFLTHMIEKINAEIYNK